MQGSLAPWITCAHCGFDDRHHGLGLCGACYSYQYRTGRPRPLSHPTRCVVCTGRLTFNGCRAICRPCSVAAHRRGLRAADVYAGPGIGVLRQTRAVTRRLERVQQEAG